MWSIVLKSKASRLRDWNLSPSMSVKSSPSLLKSKASRLRDWNSCRGQSETGFSRWLKSKASRLRDWNMMLSGKRYHRYLLLKSKASRLRDWNLSLPRSLRLRFRSGWNQKHLDYEIETRFDNEFRVAICHVCWNQKHLDYEIETRLWVPRSLLNPQCWNQKHLDYEIETGSCYFWRCFSEKVEIKSISITRLKLQWSGQPHQKSNFVEIKSISITRLKHDIRYVPAICCVNCWNQKHLDYEIETTEQRNGSFSRSSVEIKSISITRLKLHIEAELEKRRHCWNQKHLDYEIETGKAQYQDACHRALVEIKSISITRLKLQDTAYMQSSRISLSWNQKHLDYEIETASEWWWPATRPLPLKSKASRLRDWNSSFAYSRVCPNVVEIKSISITRLKPLRMTRCHSPSIMLKSKVSRLRDWNGRILRWTIATIPLKSKVSRLRDWNGSDTLLEFVKHTLLKSKVSRLRDWNSLIQIDVSRYIVSWNQKSLDYEIETLVLL